MTSDSDATSDRAAIIPRWEWRTFADLDDAEAQLLRLKPERVQDSDEVYLLSTFRDTSVKLRDEVVDVKQLQRRDAGDLELWMPVMKAAFPLSANDVETLLVALGVLGTPLDRSSYTREEFANELVRPNPNLHGLPVHKRRTHYIIDECMVELSSIDAASQTVRTIAIESPDPTLVRSTIDRLGLDGRTNTNMASGLKTVAGFGTKRNAVIDVGTNSVKFHLAERTPDGTVRTIADRAEITRLGEGLEQSATLSRDAIQRTVDAIANLRDEALREGAAEIAIVATAGLRSATNAQEFEDALRTRCGVDIEVISGEEEGRLAYLAATSALPIPHGRLVVFDSGGGSSQFTFGQPDHVEERFSLDVGAVRIAERYGLEDAGSSDTLANAMTSISGLLQPLAARPSPDAVIGIGGTVTNLAAVKHGLTSYDPDVVHGTNLDISEIDRQIDIYRTRTAAERREIAGLQSSRAEVILSGACIVRTILTTLGKSSLTVSDRGLRHGVFVERFA